MTKLFTPTKILILALVVFLFMEFDLLNKVKNIFNKESFDGVVEPDDIPMPTDEEERKEPKDKKKKTNVSGTTPYTGDSGFMNLDEESSARIKIPECPGNNTAFISSSLLPKGTQEEESFAEFAPANISGKNFVDSTKYVIGMQSQTLRNANLQLRSDPPISKENICPWNNSTINPEVRRPLEMGK